jgi:MFS family permease
MNQSRSSVDSFEISQGERLRARKNYNIFSIFNTFSYLLLSGNIISLYLLRLGAGGTLIGIVSSFMYISFFFLLPGRILVQRVGVEKLFAYSWTARCLAAVPMLFSPFFVLQGKRNLGLALALLGALGFQAMRGIGMVSNSPILGDLSEGKDRGDYLSKIQIINQTASIFAGLLMAFLLGNGQASLLRYSVLILLGILTGLFSCIFLFRLPPQLGGGFPKEEGVLASIQRSLKDTTFSRFIKVFFLITVVAGISRPFLVLYAADVFGISDSHNMFLSVIGSLGALVMGMVAQMLLDRLGAKPLLVFFSFAFLISLIPLTLPLSIQGMGKYLFLSALFFLFNFGTLGQENASQTYFFGAVRPQDQMNLGILYYLIFGIGGTIGSTVGGVLLDWIQAGGYGGITSYRIFFTVIVVLALLSLIGTLRLSPIGSVGIRNALTVIFSARDLRAILLLNKLDRTTSIEGERRVIQEMSETPSFLSVEGLLQRLKSPSFLVRREALLALNAHELDDRVLPPLIHEITNNEFTTAYLAARILGMHGIHKAIPQLRAALGSEDYLLCAESMVALARLGDMQSKGKIELFLKVTHNPLLIIYGAEALKLFGDFSSLPVLFEILEKEKLPESARNHIILSIAGLFRMDDWFYPAFTLFLEEPFRGIEFLLDRLRERRPNHPLFQDWERILDAFYAIPESPEQFGAFAGELFQELNTLSPAVRPYLEKKSLYTNPVVAFLIGSIAVQFALDGHKG